MISLQKKHKSQRDSLEIQRKKEFEIIERRFVNIWNEMEAKYRKDFQKMKKLSPVKRMELREGSQSIKNRSFYY